MGSAQPVEKISFNRPKELTGIEVVSQDHSMKCTRALSTTYIIATNLDNVDPHTYGKARYRGKMHHAVNGDTVLVEPGEIIDVKYLSRPIYCRNLFISSDALENIALELGIPGPRPHFKLHVTSHPALFRAFKNFHQSLETPCTALERQTRWANCSRLLLETAAEKTPPPPPRWREKRAVRRSVEFLHENFNQDISLESLAASARLSPFHFLREFKRELGVPPHHYQIQLRLAKARELLRQGIDSARAAIDTGFYDQSHLIRHFKKSILVSPAQYAGSK